MARRQEEAENHWPGFVDALSTIVMVVTFLLIILGVVIFVIAQQIKASVGDSEVESEQTQQYFDPKSANMVADRPDNAQAKQAQIVEAIAEAAKQKAEEAKAKAEQTQAELELEQVKAETAQAQADMAKAEAAKAESEAVKAESEAVKAESEAVKAESEAVKAESEAVKAESEAVKAESEAEKAESEAVKAESEAEKAESEAVRAESDAVKAESEAAEAQAEAVEAQAQAQSQASKLEAQKLKTEALANKAKITLAAELRQDRVTEFQINGQKVISRQVDESKTITIAADERPKDFRANIVQSADAILTLIFDGKSVTIDDNSAEEIQKFLSDKNIIKQHGKIEIRSYVNLNQSSMGEQRRLAFYRAMGARNELLKLEVEPSNISIKVKEVDDETLEGKLKIFIKP